MERRGKEKRKRRRKEGEEGRGEKEVGYLDNWHHQIAPKNNRLILEQRRKRSDLQKLSNQHGLLPFVDHNPHDG
jgi:hypothetical protein